MLGRQSILQALQTLLMVVHAVPKVQPIREELAQIVDCMRDMDNLGGKPRLGLHLPPLEPVEGPATSWSDDIGHVHEPVPIEKWIKG